MTTVELLARVRTLLDEDEEQFWLDTEVYSALTDAQNEVIKTSWAKFKSMQNSPIPLVLRPLIVSSNQTALTGTSFALPANYFDKLSIKVGVTSTAKQIPAIERPQNFDKYYVEDNPYLQSSPITNYNTDFYFDIIPPNIIFETALVAGQITMDYIIIPPEIALGVNPTIDQVGHEAMVWFAWAMLLNKAKLPMAEGMKMYSSLVGLL